MTKKQFEKYKQKFEQKVKKYVPPKDEWTPTDHAVYGPEDLYTVPIKEAKELQYKAIKYQFQRHFNNNSMYHDFCKQHNITPANLKNYEDLEKIPLIPDKFYKDYPHGKEFALWLANAFTTDIPKIKITNSNPSFDDVINAFNANGLAVAYSSGTSGRHTFIPRDQRTFNIAEYGLAKAAIFMAYPVWDPTMHGYLLMPNPFKTNVYAGKVGSIYFDVIQKVNIAIDKALTTETIQATMSQQGGLKSSIVKFAVKRMYKKIVNDIIKWLKQSEKNGTKIVLAGAPFIVYAVTNTLQEEGTTLDFADNGAVITGGGWKIHEDKRIPISEFRNQVHQTLGIRPEHCLDLYSMVEANGWMAQCPEGHYLHVPLTYLHPMVLDEEYQPIGYGEYGRFAFLDGSTFSYPGFIISGDRVRLLKHCPVCNRPGPVLEPEVTRATGQEMRGCAEEMRRMLSADLGKG